MLLLRNFAAWTPDLGQNQIVSDVQIKSKGALTAARSRTML